MGTVNNYHLVRNDFSILLSKWLTKKKKKKKKKNCRYFRDHPKSFCVCVCNWLHILRCLKIQNQVCSTEWKPGKELGDE